jgi:hypothetical protein
MFELRDKTTDEYLGTIDDEELQFLIDDLEEESAEDRDYYIDPDTIEMLQDDGAPASLITLLQKSLGSRDGIEVRWRRV